MGTGLATLVILALAFFAFATGRKRARGLAAATDRPSDLHSRPVYHGWFVGLACGLPAVALWILALAVGDHMVQASILADLPPEISELSGPQLNRFLDDAQALATGGRTTIDPTPALIQASEQYASLNALRIWISFAGAVGLGVIGLGLALRKIEIGFRARQPVERILMITLLLAATISILTTIGIVFSVLIESIRFFEKVPIFEFLFGLNWSPQTALRVDQVGSSGAFGAVPLFVGTALVTLIAMLVAGPIGLLSAIYLAEYAHPRFRAIAKPILEVLAGIPTVVYGFFAALVMAPFFRDAGASIGISVSSESAIAAGVVMGIMIIPFVSSLTDDAIAAVPKQLHDGSLALGATRQETITGVIIPAALPGIVAGFLLAISRAVGETMIVVMAAGLAANLTINPLETVTTVTVQIVTLLVGDQEFDSAKTLAAFALGLVLFIITLALNVVALRVVQKYREKYD